MPDLMLCVRSSSGRFQGYVEAVRIYDGDSFAQIDCHYMPGRFPAVEYVRASGAPVGLGEKVEYVEMLGLNFPATNHATHVGNILWDSMDISEADVNRLLKAMRESEMFYMEDGTLDFWAAWREPERVKRNKEGRLVF